MAPATGQLTSPLNANVIAATAFAHRPPQFFETVHAVDVAESHEAQRGEHEDSDACAEVASIHRDGELIREQLVRRFDGAIGRVIVKRFVHRERSATARHSLGNRFLDNEEQSRTEYEPRHYRIEPRRRRLDQQDCADEPADEAWDRESCDPCAHADQQR